MLNAGPTTTLAMISVIFQNPEPDGGKENKLKNMFKICLPRKAGTEVKFVHTCNIFCFCVHLFRGEGGVFFIDAAIILSLVMRQPAFCICENKDADQLREADQRLCFRYIPSTISLLPKYNISSL